MTSFRLPERLSPANLWTLLQAGVIDVGALLCYLAAALIIGLLVWRIIKRTRTSAYVLLGVVAALGLTTALAPWPDHVPPLYWDQSASGVLQPTEELQHRLAAACGTDALTLYLSAPDGQRDPLIHAFLSQLRAPGVTIEYIDHPYAPGGAINSLFVHLGSGSTEVPYDRLITVNPADTGAQKRWFKVQAELIQAVELIRAQPPTIYRLAGPEDAARPTVLMGAVRGITADALLPLNLDQPVPSDCTFIIMDNPRQDLTEQQASLLKSYLGRAGRLLLITDYAHGAMPNLNGALEEYGLQAIDGVVFDPGAAMGGRAEYPMPALEPNGHIIGRWLNSGHRMPLMPLSHGILARRIDGVDGTALLITTDQAYCQLNAIEHASLDMGEHDPQGPFALAAAAQAGNGKVVWIASTDMMTIEADADVGGANKDLLLASMRWLMDAQTEPVPAQAIG